jgi:hypothetical protein
MVRVPSVVCGQHKAVATRIWSTPLIKSWALRIQSGSGSDQLGLVHKNTYLFEP